MKCCTSDGPNSATRFRKRGNRREFVAITLALGLAGCATPPRGPAASLATAGISSANALSRDYRTTATRLREVAISDAFANTLAICGNPNLECTSQLAPDSNRQAREELARAIELRGRAVEALAAAYEALKREAEYDARGDLVSASNTAIEAVNGFAGAIAAVSGAAAAPATALISEPLTKITGFGVGLIADRSQKKRLKNASLAIAPATRRLRDALSVEAYVFNDLAGYLAETRVSASKSLLDAGLASHESIVTPMIQTLELDPASGMEGTISKSLPTRAAVKAVLEARAKADLEETGARYAAALNALDELLKAHAEFDRDRPLSLADLDRFLAELNAAVLPKVQEKP